MPFTSFGEFDRDAGGNVWFAFDESRPLPDNEVAGGRDFDEARLTDQKHTASSAFLPRTR